MSRLLSLNSYHYRRGGSDVVYFEHEAVFSTLGWDVAHMAMHHPKNLHSPWADYFVDELEFGHSYGFGQKLVMAAKVVYSAEARRKLSALLRRFPADIAHVHCIYHHLSPSVLPLLSERGIPVVLTAHDLKIACPAYKMLNGRGVCERCKNGNLLHLIANRCVRDSLAVSTLVAIESMTSRLLGLYRRNVDRVVVPSRFYALKLQEWGWPAQRLVHIPNFVDASAYTPQPQPGSAFIYFGRLAPEKGVGTLIRAAIKSGLPLKIVGAGPSETELKALAEGHGNVEFLGFLSGDALWQHVRSSLAVVLPSEWYENAPMSILEAYALGKPVVGARIGGIEELVTDGETGLGFCSGSVDSLADALTRLHAMPAHRIAEMGRAARSRVETSFTRERYLDAMLQLYADLGVDVRTASKHRHGRAA